MKVIQTIGLLVLIATFAPAPKVTARWAMAIRKSEALGEAVASMEARGIRLEALPVVPLKDLRAGESGVVCDEVKEERGYVPVCLAEDAVYLSEP